MYNIVLNVYISIYMNIQYSAKCIHLYIDEYTI